MTSIIDYAHTQYYYKGLAFSLFDFFRSEEWKHYIKEGTGDIPLSEGIELMIRLADQKKFSVDVPLFGAIICKDITDEEEGGTAFVAFKNWLLLERRNELSRIRLMNKYLMKNRFYPYILYPMFNQQYTSTEKARQLFTTITMWNVDHVRRPFFMLVFKYSKRLASQLNIRPDLNVLPVKRNRGKDPLYAVYVEAGNAFWDYVAHLEGKVEVVGRRAKKRDGAIFNAVDLEHEWIEWMGGQRKYGALIQYRTSVENKQRERARFTVLMEFLWMYLKKDAIIDDPLPTKQGKPRELRLKIQKVHE